MVRNKENNGDVSLLAVIADCADIQFVTATDSVKYESSFEYLLGLSEDCWIFCTN